jgi:1-acyl-sn-glycerol-3-phosphate acyltransferase
VTVRKLKQKRGWAFSIGVAIVKPFLLATTVRDWEGGENIPESGGFILVLNHISHLDPFMAAHVTYDHGRLPRYLAKSGLFKNKLLGFFLRSAGQIPVERLSKNAVGAYDAAVAAVRNGECVVVYPEGTITRDPDGWPMIGKTGAARIALETGCPVIPVGQWGAQQLLAPYAKKPDLFPRKRIQMKVGTPVDLADRAAQPRSAAATAEATDRIMAAITALVEDVRGAAAPAERFDPKKEGVSEIGNPNRHIPGEDPA